VLRAGPAGWPVAADPVHDYDGPGAARLAALAGRLSAAPVPVVAVLSGRIAGGALALSQAAGLRMALADTVFSAPEFALGLIPAAGGLVRLARRAGAAQALTYVTSGHDWDAQAAMALGLCDAVASAGAIESAAVSVALQVAEQGGEMPFAPRDGSAAAPQRSLGELAAVRAGLVNGAMAPVAQRAAEVAEAALLLPLPEALDFEAVALDDLREAELAQALHHVARAERAAAQAGFPLAPEVDLHKIALWNQSDKLALALLEQGRAVVMGASDPAALEPAFSRIAHAQEAAVQAGTLDPETREADWARLGAALDPAGLGGADLLLAAPQADELPALQALGLPLVLAGFAPARAQDLRLDRLPGVIALSTGGAEAAPLLAPVAALLRTTGDLVIQAAPGLGARLRAAFWAAAERAVLAGAAPDAVDAALRDFGFPEPPFVQADRVGIETVLAQIAAAGRAPGAFFTFLQLEGQTGRAAGRGVYLYAGHAPQPAPGLSDILAALRSEAGITPQRLPAREIVARVLAELAGEGAQALQRGQVHRAGDLDLLALRALGFPRVHGGPLFQADRAGLLATRKRLRALVAEGAPAPVTLWDVLIRNGRKFGDLDD
ncbi:MAG: enoyl-CoA hydratase-related protein, partial [Paracoccaceae bacterium]|nr:enoyl-CoA hydratase-related protein [Paracoccaceae bacterium]